MQLDSRDDSLLVNNDIDEDNKSTRDANVLKTIAIIASIVAFCGVVFGIYCVVRLHQKDNQIADLKDQIDNTDDENVAQNPEGQEPEKGDEAMDIGSNLTENLYLIGDTYTKRRYYLGVTDPDPGQDTREKKTYIIDTTKLGSDDVAKKYDLKTVLNQAESSRVASLPDILAEGTTNATPKSDCQSYKVVAGDPANLPSSIDWTIATDWSNKLPLTIYMACIIKSGGEHSLGTGLYSLDPNTNELIQLTDKFY